jgi:predicted P-loop ATPase
MVEPIDISEAVAAAKKQREKRASAKEAAARQREILHETIDMERVETPVEEDMVAAFDRVEAAAIKATCDKLKATYEGAAFTEDSKGGILAKDPHNTVLAIRKLGVFLRYDQFNGRYAIYGLLSHGPVLDDRALRRLHFSIHENFGFFPPKALHDDAVLDLAGKNCFHPVRDYFGCLKWDGTPRLNKLFGDYFDAEPIDYLEALSATWLILATRRMRSDKPIDQKVVPTILGRQGNDKGEALKVLAVRPEWYSDNFDIQMASEEILETFAGKLIVEHAEMDSIRRYDTGKVKVAISRSQDKARQAYDRLATERARQFVLAATANHEKIFHDETGNRRWYPLKARNIRIPELRRDRDQLWAEAVHRERAGESTEIPRKFWATQAEQARDRLERSEVTQTIVDAFDGFEEGFIATHDIWRFLGIEGCLSDQKRHGADKNRAMVEMGFLPIRLTIDEDRLRGFYKPDTNGQVALYRPTKRIVVTGIGAVEPELKTIEPVVWNRGFPGCWNDGEDIQF